MVIGGKATTIDDTLGMRGPPVKRSENPFLTYINNHPGCDAAALKQLFRLLAKRTHPDLGAENEADFVRLQDAYNEAIAELIRRHEGDRGAASPERPSGSAPFGDAADKSATGRAAGSHEVWLPSTPRERVLHFLYRYKAHLRSLDLEAGGIPPACRRAFGNALEASGQYAPECHHALEMFNEQFHTNRRETARYPEVATKYRALVRALASFFDFCVISNKINVRLVRSFLSEIKPVTDFNPDGPPEVRSNRSAAARSAMYRMRKWIESELEAGPCRIL
jgi:hypothetical protein